MNINEFKYFIMIIINNMIINVEVVIWGKREVLVSELVRLGGYISLAQ